MADLPADVRVLAQVRDGEPEVLLDIEGTILHLHPLDARQIGAALVLQGEEAERSRELDQ